MGFLCCGSKAKSKEQEPAGGYVGDITFDEPIDVKFSDVKDLFDTFDFNKDGLIAREEIMMNFKSLKLPISDDDVDFMMAMYDTNGDGSLNFLEFTKLIKHYMETKDFPLDEMFQYFDTDGDKHITAAEFVKAMRCLGVDMTAEQASEILPYYYTPGTTAVDYENFVKLMKTFLA
ncbi:hypothetical protein BsWGS_10830 [Bradybaena similaris]